MFCCTIYRSDKSRYLSRNRRNVDDAARISGRDWTTLTWISGIQKVGNGQLSGANGVDEIDIELGITGILQ